MPLKLPIMLLSSAPKSSLYDAQNYVQQIMLINTVNSKFNWFKSNFVLIITTHLYIVTPIMTFINAFIKYFVKTVTAQVDKFTKRFTSSCKMLCLQK